MVIYWSIAGVVLATSAFVEQWQPSAVFSGAGNALLDKVHSFDSVVNIGKHRVLSFVFSFQRSIYHSIIR
jgi:hypothetical protein